MMPMPQCNHEQQRQDRRCLKDLLSIANWSIIFGLIFLVNFSLDKGAFERGFACFISGNVQSQGWEVMKLCLHLYLRYLYYQGTERS